MNMERNLPATADAGAARPERSDERAPVARQRPVSVALLPLAIVTFVVLAFTMAAWTFVATAY